MNQPQMHKFTRQKTEQFAADYNIGGSLADKFERYVAATIFDPILDSDNDLVDTIEEIVTGGGADEGIDAIGFEINERLVTSVNELEEVWQPGDKNRAKVIFIQAKTSIKIDEKLVAKFLHGVETVTKYALDPVGCVLPAGLKPAGTVLEQLVARINSTVNKRIVAEMYYVTTRDAHKEPVSMQVNSAIERIANEGLYGDGEHVNLTYWGHRDIAKREAYNIEPKSVEVHLPNIKDISEGIPSLAEQGASAFMGTVSVSALLSLLLEESGEFRAGIFRDNVRLHLGDDNPVNKRIYESLCSESRQEFPLLNNGLTVVAKKIEGATSQKLLTGYQIVNGGQTCHQVVRWWREQKADCDSAIFDKVHVPLKLVVSERSEFLTQVTISTNLQSGIGNADIQSSSDKAKDVEKYFAASGAEGYRYQRQRGISEDSFPAYKKVSTAGLNRAVASALLGESSRAISDPKSLEKDDSLVWMDYPNEAFYFAVALLKMIEPELRAPAGSPELTLMPAKYHVVMMVSAILNPQLAEWFSELSVEERSKKFCDPGAINSLKGAFDVSGSDRITEIQSAIGTAIGLVENYFKDIMCERRLRRDDLRGLAHQRALLDLARKSKNNVLL